MQNDGNTTIPAGTQFKFHSNKALSVGLFGDQQLNEDWNIALAGSGYDATVILYEPLLPGQSKKFLLSTVEVSAFSQYSLELSDPDTALIDTNYYNNKAGMRCTVVVFGLPACSATR
ncbi:hypothetical protein C5E05_05890 [Pseudoclavibacter sp. AY1H1]|nr:hypothetical protein C5E05_05890 [Pseudoclavibacter sp. AY1H1]